MDPATQPLAGGTGISMAAPENWTPASRHAVAASYVGWTLDAFDFFVLTFVFPDLAAQFGVPVTGVSAFALTITLILRPLGAFIFGRLADTYGRKTIFTLNIALYSVFGFLTAFAPSLTVFFIIRALFGIAMGGIWGVGASLAFESIHAKARGFVSGLMQSGYPSGYLFAALAFGFLYPVIGWRGMFMIGALPALLLIVYIQTAVTESPGWVVARANPSSTLSVLKNHWKLALYAIVLMTAFTFFSHGTQDLYPLFLQKQRGFGHSTVSTIAVIYNLGAILGGLLFGSLSQRFGRRRTVVLSALLAVPVAALWAFSTTAAMVAVGAFAMQFFVQGAWGVVPAHLNELSPPGARGTFPGTVYQLGNLIASSNAAIQTFIALQTGGNYAVAMASVAVCAALAIAVTVWFGPEARDVAMRQEA
jgi:SHS family lactate transporter-like MFS transporter